MTVTAIVALLVGIPLMIRSIRTQIHSVEIESNPRFSDDDHLYDIDELLT